MAVAKCLSVTIQSNCENEFNPWLSFWLKGKGSVYTATFFFEYSKPSVKNSRFLISGPSKFTRGVAVLRPLK